MGFSGVVVSKAGHYQEFLCAICQQIVDLNESVITSCYHVFCSVCLETWMNRKKSCPTCQLDLSYHNTGSITKLKVTTLLVLNLHAYLIFVGVLVWKSSRLACFVKGQSSMSD